MKFTAALLWTLLTLAPSLSQAATWRAQHEGIWDTRNHRWVTLIELARELEPGGVLVVGEVHATTATAQTPDTFIHHDNQLRTLETLHAIWGPQKVSISLGMEFLNYPNQADVDQYVAGQTSEDQFLKAVNWATGNPFAFYRQQILYSRQTGGQTVALNIPNFVAHTVAYDGKNNLTAAQKVLLPPVWEWGTPAYFQRFQAEMKFHGGASPEEVNNYFWAQSLWDDTMAWRALLHRQDHPRDILMIIVGGFHVQYGGGLPFELKNQEPRAKIKTMMQITTAHWRTATVRQALAPDPINGELADYIWVHSGQKWEGP